MDELNLAQLLYLFAAWQRMTDGGRILVRDLIDDGRNVEHMDGFGITEAHGFLSAVKRHWLRMPTGAGDIPDEVDTICGHIAAEIDRRSRKLFPRDERGQHINRRAAGLAPASEGSA